jgi:O-antigen/teichoic acid export membrane protein
MNAQTLDYSIKPADTAPRWVSKSFWSVLDQGLFSVSNFAANILLANKLGARDYGAFSVAFSYFLGFAIFHTAFLTEPALVFGAARYRDRLRSYLGTLLFGHGMLTLLCTVVLFAAGVVEYRLSDEPQTGLAMMAFALALPFLLLLWLMRRTCYIDSQPQRAAAGDGAYLVLMLVGLAGLSYTGHLSIITAIAMMGACSLAASILLMVREQPTLPTGKPDLIREVRHDHWTYGRWAAVTGIATYIPSQIFFPLLEKSEGLAAAGTLRAYANLVMPFLQANVALCMLLLPILVRTRGTERFQRIVLFGLLALAGGPVALWLVLGIFPSQALHLVYRGKYPVDVVLMWLIGFQPVVTGVFTVLHAALQAHHHPKYVFYASAAAAVAAITVGLGLTYHYGIIGAAIGMTVGFSVNAMFAAYFCWRIIWRPKRIIPEEEGDPEIPHEHTEAM